MKKDYCTWFPEKWRGVDISDCCQLHDETCSTAKFFRCLKVKIGRFHASYIAIGGGLGCWTKYPKMMLKKVLP